MKGATKLTRKLFSLHEILVFAALGAFIPLLSRVKDLIQGHPSPSSMDWMVGALCGFCGGALGLVTAAAVLRLTGKRINMETRAGSIAKAVGWFIGAGLTDAVITGLLRRWHLV